MDILQILEALNSGQASAAEQRAAAETLAQLVADRNALLHHARQIDGLFQEMTDSHRRVGAIATKALALKPNA